MFCCFKALASFCRYSSCCKTVVSLEPFLVPYSAIAFYWFKKLS
nr:MAG TPA: hypothetical protein [Caudoviricetes sp.]